MFFNSVLILLCLFKTSRRGEIHGATTFKTRKLVQTTVEFFKRLLVSFQRH